MFTAELKVKKESDTKHVWRVRNAQATFDAGLQGEFDWSDARLLLKLQLPAGCAGRALDCRYRARSKCMTIELFRFVSINPNLHTLSRL